MDNNKSYAQIRTLADQPIVLSDQAPFKGKHKTLYDLKTPIRLTAPLAQLQMFFDELVSDGDNKWTYKKFDLKNSEKCKVALRFSQKLYETAELSQQMINLQEKMVEAVKARLSPAELKGMRLEAMAFLRQSADKVYLSPTISTIPTKGKGRLPVPDTVSWVEADGDKGFKAIPCTVPRMQFLVEQVEPNCPLYGKAIIMINRLSTMPERGTSKKPGVQPVLQIRLEATLIGYVMVSLDVATIQKHFPTTAETVDHDAELKEMVGDTLLAEVLGKTEADPTGGFELFQAQVNQAKGTPALKGSRARGGGGGTKRRALIDTLESSTLPKKQSKAESEMSLERLQQLVALKMAQAAQSGSASEAGDGDSLAGDRPLRIDEDYEDGGDEMLFDD
jgi:hypothetical protein